jgi:hypothetical protein
MVHRQLARAPFNHRGARRLTSCRPSIRDTQHTVETDLKGLPFPASRPAFPERALGRPGPVQHGNAGPTMMMAAGVAIESCFVHDRLTLTLDHRLAQGSLRAASLA